MSGWRHQSIGPSIRSQWGLEYPQKQLLSRSRHHCAVRIGNPLFAGVVSRINRMRLTHFRMRNLHRRPSTNRIEYVFNAHSLIAARGSRDKKAFPVCKPPQRARQPFVHADCEITQHNCCNYSTIPNRCMASRRKPILRRLLADKRHVTCVMRGGLPFYPSPSSQR